MLRVLTRGIGGSSGLAMALTPQRPAYTLFAAKHNYVHLRLLLGFRSETLHVRHTVSMTSGCNSEKSAGVRWQEQGLGREVNVVQLMWIIKCFHAPYPFPPPHTSRR